VRSSLLGISVLLPMHGPCASQCERKAHRPPRILCIGLRLSALATMFFFVFFVNEVEAAQRNRAQASTSLNWGSGFWIWLCCLLLSGCLLFIMVFILVCLGDLESDLLNPYDACDKLNGMNAYYVVCQSVVVLLSLVQVVLQPTKGMSALSFVLNGALGYYVVSRFVRKGRLVFETTDIFRNISMHKTEAIVQLGFHLSFVFFYLYCMISSLVRPQSGPPLITLNSYS